MFSAFKSSLSKIPNATVIKFAFFTGLQSSFIFFQWYCFSFVHVQVGQELVRLINLIIVNKFLTNISEDREKNS